MKLSRVLRDLVSLIEDEALRNPNFAERLEAITANLPVVAATKAIRSKTRTAKASVPDIFSAHESRGEEEFGFWLRSLDVSTLKAIVKVYGFDPGKVTRRWGDPDKIASLIAEQAAARLRRGSGFLPPKTTSDDHGSSSIGENTVE